MAEFLFQRSHNEEKLAANVTRNHPDDSDRNDYSEQLRVDLCFYPADGIAKTEYSLRKSRRVYDARTRWAWISLLGEIKTVHDQCPFSFGEKNDREKTVDKANTEESELSAAYATAAKPRAKKSTAKSNATAPSTGSFERLQGTAGGSTGSAKRAGKACGLPQGVANTDGDSVRTEGRTQDKSQLMSFICSGQGAATSLGQMAEYVSKIFRRQHRTHLFSLFIFRGQARVIRWDRAGAIVSTVIDFEEKPSLLHEVIWRYAHMSQAQRGFDPTAALATKDEVNAMRVCEAPDQWVAQQRDCALGQTGWPAYKLTMLPTDLIDQGELKPITTYQRHMPRASTVAPAVASLEKVCFIVGKCYFATNSSTGRGTKCYIAYDVCNDRLVFLKDFWRPDVASSQPEGRVLRELRLNGIENVPTPLAAGDVRSSDSPYNQTTCTQELLSRDEKTRRRPATLIHYRLIVQEICRPLEAHESPRQLTKAMLDALIGTLVGPLFVTRLTVDCKQHMNKRTRRWAIYIATSVTTTFCSGSTLIFTG